jgi:hypothetical protein
MRRRNFIARKWHSSILNVHAFKEVNCGSDHFLVVASVWERLSISKREIWKS